jgi:hypothetical protein
MPISLAPGSADMTVAADTHRALRDLIEPPEESATFSGYDGERQLGELRALTVTGTSTLAPAVL